MHLGEELVHDENHVVRQPALAEARGVAQIDEHRDDAALAPLRTAARLLDGCGRDVRWKKRRDRHINRGTRLAGETHVGRRFDARERLSLEARRRRKLREPVAHAHAARRAARASAAYRGVRDALVADRFQDTPTDRRGNHAAGRMAHAVGSADARAQPAGEQRAAERDPESVFDPRSQIRHHGAVLRAHRRDVDVIFLHAADALDARPQVKPGARESGRDGGQEKRDRERERLRSAVPGTHAQPVMQPEAKVRPNQYEQRHLLERGPFARPEQPDDALVIDVMAEQHPGKARADDMHDEERRDGEAEHDLRGFP